MYVKSKYTSAKGIYIDVFTAFSCVKWPNTGESTVQNCVYFVTM